MRFPVAESGSLNATLRLSTAGVQDLLWLSMVVMGVIMSVGFLLNNRFLGYDVPNMLTKQAHVKTNCSVIQSVSILHFSGALAFQYIIGVDAPTHCDGSRYIAIDLLNKVWGSDFCINFGIASILGCMVKQVSDLCQRRALHKPSAKRSNAVKFMVTATFIF